MPKSEHTVRVTPIPNEPGRYRVESWSKPDSPHLVDLFSYGGRGECSCKDWQTRRGPMVKKACKVGDPQSLCRHVKACRSAFLNSILPDMAFQMNNGALLSSKAIKILQPSKSAPWISPYTNP